MRRLWLIFAQATTIALAIFFVVGALRPDWVGRRGEVAGTPPPAVGEAASAAASYREAANKALPSVVHVFTSKKMKLPKHPLFDDPVFRHFFGDRPDDEARSAGLGSGVIVSSDGYVLTNYHVVEAADQIEVALNDGSTFRARLVGSDPDTDLAVLHVDTGHGGKEPRLPAISFGRPEDVHVGDVALAIGNPFGVGQTMTMGIVSALGRSHLGINTFENFIQTDAAINPGNSGGALIDSSGALIGINTAIYSRSGGSLGIGFAIPVATAKDVMEQIIQHGSVTRGWVGVEAQEITGELAESFGLPNADGALIAGVQRGSPAEQAGVRPGDILLSIAGKPVKDPQAMLDLIAAQKPGSHIGFKLRRQQQLIDLDIKVGRRSTNLRRDAD